MGESFTDSISRHVNVSVVTSQLVDDRLSDCISSRILQRASPFMRLEFGSFDSSSCSSPDEEMFSPELDLTKNESFRQTIQRSHFAYQSRDSFVFRSDSGICEGDVLGFGPSSGVFADLNDCADSLHARNTGSFAFNERLEDLYDSEMCHDHYSNENSVLSNMERDNVSNNNNNVLRSTPVSISVSTTSNKCLDNRAKVNQYDNHQPLFGGGSLTTGHPTQEGMMSLGFPTVKMYWEESPSGSSSSDADEALPEFIDSFQCNHFALISPGGETFDNHEELRRLNLNEAPSLVIKSERKTTLTLQRIHSLQDEPKNYPLLIPQGVPLNNKEHSSVSSNIPECVGYQYMQQASQGGSGKLLFVPVVQEEDDDLSETDLRLLAVQPKDLFQLTDEFNSSGSHGNFNESANDIISIFDGPNGYKQYYSAFLCCAQEDLAHFGRSFHQMLEGWGFKIFLPPRDLVLTGCNFDNMSRALEERCNGKIVVVLSVNYEASDECSFLTSFARVLDPDSRRRNIIPVQIDKDVQIRNALKGLSIIHYNQDYKCRWLKHKLIDAIAA